MLRRINSKVLIFLYSIGWIVAISGLLFFLRMHVDGISLNGRLFCWLIFCLPLGKLLYFHVPGLMGLKIVFLGWAIIGIGLSLAYFISSGVKIQYFLVLIGIIIFPLISLFLLDDFSSLLVYTADGQSDSILARFFSLCILVIFMIYSKIFCEKYGPQLLIKSFVEGVIAACCIGIVIFISVYMQMVGVDELLPISADTHIVSLIYRFNPGGNVNEFGILSVYALILLRIAFPALSTRTVLFIYLLLIFSLFFSLTRAAWVAYIFSLAIGVLIGGRGRVYILICLAIAPLFVGIISLINDDLTYLVTSRFALEGGAGGDERIDKVLSSLIVDNINPWKFIFGNGWATNLYMHSVPLQLVYEIGLAGFTFLSLILFWLMIRLGVRAIKCSDYGTTAVLLCLIAFVTFSAFHHTLYHMQSWFILGLAYFYANRLPIFK